MKDGEEREAAERAERVKALLQAEKLIARQQFELQESKIKSSAIGGGVRAAALLHDLKDGSKPAIARRRSAADLQGFQAKIVNSQAALDHDASKRKVELDLSIGR
jgi:hypothetical protein